MSPHQSLTQRPGTVATDEGAAPPDPAGAGDEGRGIRNRLRDWSRGSWGQVLSVVAVLAVWQLVSLRFPPVLLPGPVDLVGYLASIASSGELVASIATTLFHLGVATALVIPTATVVGFLMGRRRIIEGLGAPWVPFLQTIPDLVVIAFALIVFGLGPSGVIFVAFVISTPFMVVNVWAGVRNVDADLLQMAKAFHTSDRRVLREIVIPHALPHLLSGSRIAIGIAWHVIIFAEYLMSNVGAGAQIKAAADAYNNIGVFSWALIVVTLMLIIEYALLKPAERAVRRRLGLHADSADVIPGRRTRRAGAA